MKRTYLKRYLSTGIFLLLLIMTVCASIPFYSKLTETIYSGISGFRTELEEHFGLSFSYKRLSPSIFNGFRIKGIEVADFNDGKKIILIKNATLHYSIFKLLSRDLKNAFTELTIDGLSIDYNTEEDNEVLFRIISAIRERSKKDESVASPLDIESIFSKIPFKIFFKNIKFCFTSGNKYAEIFMHRVNLSFMERTSQLFLNIAGSAKGSSYSKKSSFDFSTAGTITENLEGSSALFRLTNISVDSYVFDRVNFFAGYKNRTASIKSIQNIYPLFFTAFFNFESGDAEAEIKAESLQISSLVFSKKQKAFMKKFSDSRISLSAGVRYNINDKSLSYHADGNADIPNEAFSGGLNFSFDVSGGKDGIKISEVKFTGEKIDARLAADYIFLGNRLSGNADINRIVLKNGGTVSAELYFDPIDGGFMCFSPQLMLDGKSFTALQLNLKPEKDSVDFNFELSDYAHPDAENPGKLNINGSYMPETKYIQANLSLSEIFLDSIAETAAFFSSGSKSPFTALSPYMFNGELYFSSDLKTASFNVPYGFVANTKKDGQFLYISMDGNDSSVQISRFDYISGGNLTHFSALLEKSPGTDSAFFTADVSSSSIPYHFAGTLSPSYLSISGDYSFALDMYRSGNGKSLRYDGSVSVDGFPFAAAGTIFTLSSDAGFTYTMQDGFNLMLSRMELSEAGSKFSFHPQISASGALSKYGLIFDSLTYSDSFSVLKGSSKFILNMDDRVFNSFTFDLNLSGQNSEESVNISADFSNPLGAPLTLQDAKKSFYLNSQAVFRKFGLDRLTAEHNDSNYLSAVFIASGTLENPYIGANIEHLGVNTGKKDFSMSASAYVEEKKLNIDAMNIKYNGIAVNDIAASFDISDFTGSLSANIDAEVARRTLIVPLKFSVSDTVIEKDSVFPKEFVARLECPEISGTLIKNSFPFELTLLHTKESTAIFTSELFGINGFISSEGALDFGIAEGKPLYFKLSGNTAGKEFDVRLSDFSLDLGKIYSYINLDVLKIFDGTLKGKVSASGMKNDPEFSGAFSLTSADFSIPTVIPSHIKIPKAVLDVNHNQIAMADTAGTINNNYPVYASLNVFFERWAFQRLESHIFTKKGSFCPVDLNINTAQITGNANVDLNIALEDKVLDISGDIAARKATMRIKNKSLKDVLNNTPVKKLPIEVRCDLNITLGNHTSFRYDPLLRAVFVPDTRFNFKGDTSESLYKIDGELEVRSGDIAYLSRNFYLKNGTLKFLNTESSFNPLITLQAETRERDENGNEVRLILSAKNQYLSDFNPTFSSIPAKSETQIRAMLGQLAVADSKNVSSFLLATGDYAIQSTIGRSIENKLRDFLNFDILSVRTSVLQNTVKLGMNGNSGTAENSQKQNFGVGNFLDNSTVYIGKYFGSALYADALMHWTYDESRIDDKMTAGGLVFKPEFGLELESPFANIRWTTAPDIDAMLNNRIVSSTSITLSWKFSF